jgi:hypothetical protein
LRLSVALGKMAQRDQVVTMRFITDRMERTRTEKIKGANVNFRNDWEVFRKKKVGAGIGATPTWGYCVCCYLDRRRIAEKVSAFAEINITKYPKVNRNLRLQLRKEKTLC